MPDRYHRVAAAAREFGAGDAFDLELNEQLPFFQRKPSPALAVIEKLLQQDFRAGILDACVRFKDAGRSRVCAISQGGARFADGPAKRATADLARDGESQVRATGLEFLGRKKFQQNRKQVLGGVVAGESRKGGGDLGRGSVNGRNEDQQPASRSEE